MITIDLCHRFQVLKGRTLGCGFLAWHGKAWFPKNHSNWPYIFIIVSTCPLKIWPSFFNPPLPAPDPAMVLPSSSSPKHDPARQSKRNKRTSPPESTSKSCRVLSWKTHRIKTLALMSVARKVVQTHTSNIFKPSKPLVWVWDLLHESTETPCFEVPVLSDILNVHRCRRFYTSLEYVSYQCLGSTPPQPQQSRPGHQDSETFFLGLGISIIIKPSFATVTGCGGRPNIYIYICSFTIGASFCSIFFAPPKKMGGTRSLILPKLSEASRKHCMVTKLLRRQDAETKSQSRDSLAIRWNL